MARYTYHCPLRWSDLDAYGHVNNARFLTLYEEARVALFFVAARACGLTSFEEGVVIARHEVDYLRPLDYTATNGAMPIGAASGAAAQVPLSTGPDAAPQVPSGAGSVAAAQVPLNALGAGPPSVRIEMWVEDVRAAQFAVRYELFDGDAVASRARSVAVPFDLARRRPRRLSDAERAFLEPWRN